MRFSLISSFLPPILASYLRSLYRVIFNKGGYGLGAIDVDIISIIKPKLNGFFIELGANDGVTQSNTYLLQKRFKWNGVLIEPSPSNFEKCVLNRSFAPKAQFFCCACVPCNFSRDYVTIHNANLMSIAEDLDVDQDGIDSHLLAAKDHLIEDSLIYRFPAFSSSLSDLLDQCTIPSTIDFLSLDTEGNEMSVLLGLDLQRHRPTWILVECRDNNVFNYLTHNSYSIYREFTNDDRKDVLFIDKQSAL
jgi:FkbM family methyltransferase